MERLRRRLLQKTPAWGDPLPGDSTSKSGQTQLSLNHDILQGCLAAYKAATAHFEKSDTVKSIPPTMSAEPTACGDAFSIQEWSLDKLISHSPNFEPVRRVSALSDAATISRELKSLESEGLPLIIEDWHQHTQWPKEEFTLEWFRSHCSPGITVRNVIDGSDKVMVISDFIDKCRSASCTERLYGKDVECPDGWRDLLHQIGLPSHILPGNPNDLLSNQPVEARVKTLMCYLGVSGTFTPCHKDLCASLGQNLMCYSESDGSALWFMTATSDVFSATQYFHSIKQDLDHERHLISIDKLAKAPFTIYIAEQKLGDLVLVPSRSCHQVINKGGITIKTSWSRMTLDGLIAANYHELPIYQRVCREETYRVKFTAYHTLRNMVHNPNAGGRDKKGRANPRLAGPVTRQRKHIDILRRLLGLYDDILNDERPHPDFTDLRYVCDSSNPSPRNIDNLQDTEEYRITCDYCGADIFQSFFECNRCAVEHGATESGVGCAICPRCYVDGRTCKCGTMVAMQCRQFQIIEGVRDAAVEVLGKLCRNKNDTSLLMKNKSNGPGIFAAACIKYQSSRSDVKSTTGINRSAQKPNSMYCIGCRRACSFQHLFAKYKTHAVDALLGSYDQQLYHKRFHGKGRKDYDEYDVNAFAESVKTGTRPNLQFQRFHNIAFFTKCLPMSQIVRPGYYDEVRGSVERSRKHRFHANPIIIPKLSLQHVSTTLHQEPMSPISALTDLSSEEEIDYPTAPTQNKKRKRFVIDCVEIPLGPIFAREPNVTKTSSSAGGSTPPSKLEIKAELPEDTLQEIPDSNADCGMTVDRCDQNQIPRELACSRETGNNTATYTTEIKKNVGKLGLNKTNAKNGKNVVKTDASKSDRRRSNGTETTRQREAHKKRITSRKRVSDGVDKSSKINEPQGQMPVLGLTEQSLSGDDSDTVVAHTPQLQASIGQNRVQSKPPDSLVSIYHRPSISSGREDNSIGQAKESTKRSLDQVDRQSGTNAEAVRPPIRKRRRLSRSSQQETNTYSNCTDIRQSSEPDGAPQLANALSSALTANDNISGSVNPAECDSRDARESGRRSVVHDCEPPKQPEPQQTSLSVDERTMFQKEISKLTNRVAALEKNIEDSKTNPPVSLIISPSPSSPMYCFPVSLGNIEGEIDRRIPAQNDILARRAINQYLRPQLPQPPVGPSKYRQTNHIQGQFTRHQTPTSPRFGRNWIEQRPQRPLGSNYNRERHQNESYQSHGATGGAPEASSSRRFNPGSYVAGPNNASRYSRRIEGEKDRSFQRWPKKPLPSPSHRLENGIKHWDNVNQQSQEPNIAGWGSSHGWDSPPASDAGSSENQHTQKPVAPGWGLSPGWDLPPISNKTVKNRNQRAQEQDATGWGSSSGRDSSPMDDDTTIDGTQALVTRGRGTSRGWSPSTSNDNEDQRRQEQVGTEKRLSRGWDSPMGNNGASNEEQESQWEDNYVQDDDGPGVGNKSATGGEHSNKPWVQNPDSGKAAAVDMPWMNNNPWTS